MQTFKPSEAEEKIWGQFGLQAIGAFEPFRMYGMQDYIAPAIEEITELAKQAKNRCLGLDVPIDYALARKCRILKKRVM
ncbi:hypothetical protein [Dehalococcoides sp. THU4]|uniref:hypothetical protein n=1 Tax=Dehalococcoides sp. THU4 TaxID=3348344 RepID=UPI00371F834A